MGVGHACSSSPKIMILWRCPKLCLLILADVLPRLWLVDFVDDDVLIVPESVESEPSSANEAYTDGSEERSEGWIANDEGHVR